MSLIALLVASASCKKPSKATQELKEQIVERDYAIPLKVYEQTVTVDASVDELHSYFTSRSLPPVRSGRGLAPETADIEIGRSFNLRRGLEGLEGLVGDGVTGKLIVVRNDGERFWYIVDGPAGFFCQRWGFRKASDKTRVTIKLEAGASRKTGVYALFIGDSNEMQQNLFEQTDAGLAAMQTHFDPSLSAETLAAHGVRGQSEDGVLQVFESETWIDAQPDEIMEWILTPENARKMLREFKLEDKYFGEYKQAENGDAIYFPSEFRYGLLHSKADAFFIKGRERVRMYMVVFNMVLVTEFRLTPGKGGTDFMMTMAGEVPTMAGSEDMDLMIFIPGMKDIMRERLTMLKKAMESGKEPA